MVILLDRLSIKLLSMEEKELDIDLLRRIALSAQIIKLSRARIGYSGRETIVLKDLGGYTISIKGDGNGIKYMVSEDDYRVTWFPGIIINGFTDFMKKIGIIAYSSDNMILYNPLPIKLVIPYRGSIQSLKPFSLHSPPTTYSSTVGDSDGIFRIGSYGVKVYVSRDEIDLLINGYSFKITGFGEIEWKNIVDSSLYIGNPDVKMVFSLTKPYVYIDIGSNTCLDICLDWLNAYAYFLTPYHISHGIVSLTSENTYYNGIVILKNTFSLGIVNPYGLPIRVSNSTISLCSGKFFINYGIYLSYNELFSQLLPLLAGLDKLFIQNYKPLSEVSELLYYYPQSILLAEYRFDHGDISMVLFNPMDMAVNTTIYSLTPIYDPIIQTARYLEGYRPVILKPNMITFTIKPHTIVVVRFRLGIIDREAVLFRTKWRQMVKLK